MFRFSWAAAASAALAIPYALSQSALSQSNPGQTAASPCIGGTVIVGAVHDSTAALIPGAHIDMDGVSVETSGADGAFRFLCVKPGAHHVVASAAGFAKRELDVAAPRAGRLDVLLTPEAVEEQVEVSGDSAPETSASSAGPTQTISGTRLQTLADDPDDLLRELQQLAAAAGGSPGNATVAVDGFQGSSALPPKSSIAYIKVNPDQFSAEYREPPFEGGRIEVYTKPGQKAYHGALFTTNGSPWENARDPFSTSKAAVGKQRYGFELTGPVRKVGSDFALTLEHRSIDNFAVVNAVTLDTAGNAVHTSANVATPQRLWLATARLDWQLGAKNTFIASYSADVNHLLNVGVGGSSLPETGYESEQPEHIFRLSDITTATPTFMHEARLSLRWRGETVTPGSSAPQVQVAGAFTGGGAAIGNKRYKELNVEFDDDAIWTTKKHTWKFGTQMLIYDEHQKLTTNFNGTYVFGSLASYRAGTPTAYTSVAGTPDVNFSMIQNALFVQDEWKAGHGVTIAYGVRWYTQNNPTVTDGAVPRVGILWSPNKKGTWTLHAHAGMFSGSFGPRTTAEVLREDGIARVTSTVYNPVFGNPSLGGTVIRSQREYGPHMGGQSWIAENIGGTRTLPHGWNLSADLYIGRMWNQTRTLNVNAPLNGVPTGPRPGPANTNIYQTQNSGQGPVNAVFMGVENHSYKRFQFFAGGVRVELTDNTNDESLFSPQSSFTDAGEFARRAGQPAWNLFGNGTLTLPKKLQLSTDYNAHGDAVYNITTGFDNNGDGNFNDRPQYAAPGTPGAIQTPYGLLVATGGTGVFPRNKGVMPWVFYVDANLQRAFVLTRNKKADHQQTLQLNVRSSNILNHRNVTSVGGVLGSPEFGIPYAADSGRRVEAGARYSF